jgi:SAM-dependent methyltransferase
LIGEIFVRWEVVKRFESQIQPLLPEIREIAVVGGSADEPELKILSENPELAIFYYGVDAAGIPEDSFAFLDLNKKTTFEKSYDLVICSQVLEHVWHYENAFENLTDLVSENGFIWIGCPASNYAHGSPHYYSAGFSPKFITGHLKPLGFQILSEEAIGSKRYYFLTHSLHVWASQKMHRIPLLFGISRFYPKEALFRLIATFINPSVSANIKWATETLVLARKRSL